MQINWNSLLSFFHIFSSNIPCVMKWNRNAMSTRHDCGWGGWVEINSRIYTVWCSYSKNNRLCYFQLTLSANPENLCRERLYRCVCVYGVWVWVCVFEVGEGVLGLSLVILRCTNFQYTDPPPPSRSVHVLFFLSTIQNKSKDASPR